MLKFYSILIFFILCFLVYNFQFSKVNALDLNEINPSEQYGKKWSNDDDLEDLINLGKEGIQKLEKDDFSYTIKKLSKYRLGYLFYEDRSSIYIAAPIYNIGSQPMKFLNSRNFIYDFEKKEKMPFYLEIYQPNKEPLYFQYEANCKEETLWVSHVIDGIWQIVGDMEFDEAVKNIICKIDHTINSQKAFCMMHREFMVLRKIFLIEEGYIAEEDFTSTETLSEAIQRKILDYDYCSKNFEMYPNAFE